MSFVWDQEVDMSGRLISTDGTPIAFDKLGKGPPVVIVGGILGDRSQQGPLAELLSTKFTVFNYDRRGHGESGNEEPYAIEREIEDLDIVFSEAGAPAFVYGTSGCAVLSLLAAAGGLAPKIKRLVIWEPPFFVDGTRPKLAPDYLSRLKSLLAEGRRREMVELFMSEAVGMPAEFVAQMHLAPWFPSQESLAHTLIYETTMMGDYSIPRTKIASIKVPTLVLDGGQTSWLTATANAIASILPNAQRRTIDGQPHNVDHNAMAPVLIEFFEG